MNVCRLSLIPEMRDSARNVLTGYSLFEVSYAAFALRGWCQYGDLHLPHRTGVCESDRKLRSQRLHLCS